MSNEIKGFKINGVVYKYDYRELDNKPNNTQNLPVVTASDEGKFAVVDSEGNWAAVAIPSAEEESF